MDNNISRLLLGSKGLEEFINRWNIKFPFDNWWRAKHNIPLFSKEHLDSNFMANKMEFLEEVFKLKEIKDSKPEEKEATNEVKEEGFVDFDMLQKTLDK